MLWCQGTQNIELYPTINFIRAKVHHVMCTMHAPDRRTNIMAIAVMFVRLTNASRAKNGHCIVLGCTYRKSLRAEVLNDFSVFTWRLHGYCKRQWPFEKKLNFWVLSGVYIII